MVKHNALLVTTIPVKVISEAITLPCKVSLCIANVGLIDKLYLTGRHYLLQPDKNGITYMPVFNCAPYKFAVSQNDFVTLIENVTGSKTCEKS